MFAIGLAITVLLPAAHAQLVTTTASSSATRPEPVYWRQNLFLIPYQWSAASDPGGAESVWLYVSKDRGATWQKISEARPQVRAFNYHAEADGEYWFAIRTADGRGGFWPDGPIEPELRVIVDTTIPRFEKLSGMVRDDGSLDVDWRVADANLDAQSWRVEVQTDAAGDWQVVTLPQSTPAAASVAAGRATTQLSNESRAVAVRVSASDLAGNRAVSQTEVSSVAVGRVAGDPLPAIGPAISVRESGDEVGWVASRAATGGLSSSSEPPPNAAPVANQPWPADNRGPAIPFPWAESAAGLANATLTHGMPRGAADPAGSGSIDRVGNGVASEFASLGGPGVAYRANDDPAAERRSPFAPLEPFRQQTRNPWDSTDHAEGLNDMADAGAAGASVDPWLWLSGPEVTVPPGATPKLVSSRTFLLEYELEEVGPWGVAKVELWGTRDGGRTWRSYAEDDNHSSPMQVTVGDSGLYGFRIVVSGGGGVGGFPPQPGDRPELWVGVDLHRPEIELTAAEPASGELAGHLLLRWWTDDDNLQPRPIGLFYSSRPAGPWTAIATNLENTGEYPWRLERHLPPRVYLRLEARDTAGNLAAYQTYEPLSIELPPPSGRIQSVGAMERPTSSSLPDSYR
jgi:hypothetical protein